MVVFLLRTNHISVSTYISNKGLKPILIIRITKIINKMKKLMFLVASVLISGASFVASASQKILPTKTSNAQIEQQQDELLVLTPASTDIELGVMGHYSHSSHGSHGSHGSHASHASHFSSR